MSLVDVFWELPQTLPPPSLPTFPTFSLADDLYRRSGGHPDSGIRAEAVKHQVRRIVHGQFDESRHRKWLLQCAVWCRHSHTTLDYGDGRLIIISCIWRSKISIEIEKKVRITALCELECTYAFKSKSLKARLRQFQRRNLDRSKIRSLKFKVTSVHLFKYAR